MPRKPGGLYRHQLESLKLYATSDIVFDASDPGTGKTRVAIEASKARACPVLVVCPKSIQWAAWGRDILTFTPELAFSIISADDKYAGWSKDAQVYIINTDAVKWLIKQPPKLLRERFDGGMIIFDESSKFKNPSSARSKAARKLAQFFKYRACLSGTPMPRSIEDIWHQVALLDNGKRLGSSFYAFRAATCIPKQVGASPYAIQWTAKPDAHLAVAGLIKDITIRHKLEDCVDMPEHIVRVVEFDLSASIRRSYEEMRKRLVIELKEGEVTAVNAAVLAGKLQQIASGAVYNSFGKAALVDPSDTRRAELVIELAAECEQALVFYMWDHQLEALEEQARANQLVWRVINGSVPLRDRDEAVSDFQAGKIDLILAHPASAGHGLTLTKATRCIWASPTYDAELFDQGSRRIYRIGQTQRTENIIVMATNTIEQHVADILTGKRNRQASLLSLLQAYVFEDGEGYE